MSNDPQTNLRLEPLEIHSHLEDCHEIFSDPHCFEWSTRAPFTELQQTREFILKTASSDADWAIMLLSPATNDAEDASLQAEKPKLIGVIGMHKQPNAPAGALAYKLNSSYWGKGYMTSAVKLFVDMFWGLEAYISFTRLDAGVDPENHASRRVLEKAGFQKGVLRQEEIERAIYKGQNRKKSDIQEMYIDRPETTK